jgi:hypothetical protein
MPFPNDQLTIGNPLLKGFFVQDFDTSKDFPPDPSEFRITDNTIRRVADNGVKRITD